MGTPASNEIPKHIAIIMDGNGRWASARGLPRAEGHRAGAEAVREAVETCRQIGVQYLTLYAFSSENWNRPKKEIDSLMKLLERFLREKLPELLKQNVRFHTIGRHHMLPAKCRKQIENAVAHTKDNTGLNLVLALSYGSREEITDAARALATQVADGTLKPEDIDCETVAQNLYTKDFPDPDLLIRTSGELRISNFLLWQISYSEIVISHKNWPDFRNADLRQAVEEYARRHRRFGTV
ncbi:MAG: isoprenyl transferase [Verrucomicrobiae bacterium]|nr:isoprenyl transferase [Verrucomicrobiae bacterium]NNJ86418.1 isoprenyl transferase [Akkermansiaceae bacterium]